MAETTVYRAAKIVTMNPSNPTGTHVAVRHGRILGVGSLDEVAGWGEYTLDDSLADKTIVPGFIEAHGHMTEGGLWAVGAYAGYFSRTSPDGEYVEGVTDVPALIERLRTVNARMDDPDEPLLCWGVDPLFFGPEDRLSVNELDQVSTTRPIMVLHLSGHAASVNTALLDAVGITADIDAVGLAKHDGRLTGELKGHPAMFMAGEILMPFMAQMGSAEAILNFAKLANRAGHTTCTELGTVPLHDPEGFALWESTVSYAGFPARVVAYFGAGNFGAPADPDEVIPLVLAAQQQSNSEKLTVGGIKIWSDGSNQGFTGRLQWPGYYNGAQNGVWYVVPEQFIEHISRFHAAGLNCHVHTNGNEATELFIDAVDAAVRAYPWLDHRHTAQHNQLATPAQLRRMRQLGMCANFFINHVYYYGDQHYEQILGPERANQVNPCGAALREGVSFSMHSDSPVTPIGHLTTMWCAVNRVTATGRLLGAHERISAYAALSAATIDAAYQLHLDHEIGSLEVGKRADFTVLDESPLDVAPAEIRDIPVWGTVLGGVPFPV